MKGILDSVPGSQSKAGEAQGRVAAGLIPASQEAAMGGQEGTEVRNDGEND